MSSSRIGTTSITEKQKEDIIFYDILTRVPVKSILRFRCVCKSWCSRFTHDLCFIKKHHNNVVAENDKNSLTKLIVHGGNTKVLYSIDVNTDDDVSANAKVADYPFSEKTNTKRLSILGTCNGIVCMVTDRIFLWNPATREYKAVPASPLQDNQQERVKGSSPYSYGFGYDLNSDDFKLVRIESCANEASKVVAYSLASHSWKTIQCHMPYKLNSRSRGLYFNGALHWITNCTRKLVSFNLGEEMVRQVLEPETEDGLYMSAGKYVHVLGGCLCMVYILPRHGDVWVMKEYGVNESWTKLFTISQEAIPFSYFSPIKAIRSENGADEQYLLNVHSKEAGEGNVLVLHNPGRGSTKVVDVHGDQDPKCCWLQANTCTESLFSLFKEGGSVARRREIATWTVIYRLKEKHPEVIEKVQKKFKGKMKSKAFREKVQQSVRDAVQARMPLLQEALEKAKEQKKNMKSSSTSKGTFLGGKTPSFIFSTIGILSVILFLGFVMWVHSV